MIKKILFFISLFFLISPRIYAATSLESDVFINNNSLTTQNYIVVQPNTWFDLKLTMQLNVSDNTSSYVRLTMCFDGTITQYNTAFPNIFTDMLVVSTNQSCSYYNSTYKGKIVNLYFNYNATESASFTNNMEILSTGGSIGLLSVAASDIPYDFSNGSDTIIDQNQTIIEGNNAIKDELGNLNDNLNDNFNSCRDSINLIDISSMVPGFVLDDGTFNNTYGTVGRMRSNFLKVDPNTTYTFSIIETSSNFNKWIGINLYSSNSIDTFIQRLTHNTSNTFTFTTTSDTNYIVVSGHNIMNSTKIQLQKGSSITKYEPFGEICTNRIDETNSQLNDLNNNITNNNVSGVEESFLQFEDFLDDNSTITQLITLPVTLYSSILSGVSNSCSPFNLGSLYGESLILPCINIGNYLGSTLWGMIDLIISGFAIYSISKKLIKVFNNFSSMKDGDVIDD